MHFQVEIGAMTVAMNARKNLQGYSERSIDSIYKATQEKRDQRGFLGKIFQQLPGCIEKEREPCEDLKNESAKVLIQNEFNELESQPSMIPESTKMLIMRMTMTMVTESILILYQILMREILVAIPAVG